MKQPPHNKKKILLFKTVAILGPVLLLLVLEGLLRLFGYGHDLSLFVKDPAAPGYMVMNQDVSKKYFSNDVDATVGNQEHFRAEKQPGALRIFVLGESTTIGFPYMHNGSFHRMLKYRLMHTFPDKPLEVINLSLTAVNSYTVLDFARQLANWQPDAVLIYCGHNEYYGALGVGSTSHLSNNPFLIHTLMTLRTWRLGQLLTNMVGAIQRMFTGHPDKQLTLMRRMAGQQEIPYGSELYIKGVLQFQRNMTRVCQTLSDENIPVFISTLVSNERDLKPFIGGKGEHSASALYLQAQAAYVEGDYPIAKLAYVNAKDLDLLRFRAPDTLNTLIHALARQYTDVTVVETHDLFEQHSPHGILGNETLLEHVHPNLFGYALLSEAFYQSIKAEHIIPGPWPNDMSFDEFLHAMPVTRVDSLKGAYEIAQLRSQWPFDEPSAAPKPNGFEEQLAMDILHQKIAWNQAMDTLLPWYIAHNNYPEALKVAESALLEYPDEPVFYNTAARLSVQLGLKARAATYMQKAFELSNTTR